ncbi:ABC transporter ATP-binding protein [Ornithinibacillus sp. 4-3]|uniref:ABC transporter ATP-binding protein n=1 Tax=Ornithinibacillus sp. 4-3 TaxID=3231488 RepID=A0AB39HVX8_9BACI
MNVNINQAGYEENVATVENIHFNIEASQLLGMIGPNGAGKSTTIKTILGQVAFFEGNIEQKEGTTYSFIPERPIYYDELTLWEHFEFVAAVEGLGEESLIYAKQFLEKFKLIDHLHEFPRSFSKGMQQKGMIALALFTKPDILIIDEPFMGLDPSSTKLLLKLIDDECKKGTGVLMCTHILDTAQRICDSFIIIEKGLMKANGNLQEVLKQCDVHTGSLYDCIADEEDINEE